MRSVASSMWVVVASMWPVAAPMWDMVSSMSDGAASMYDLQAVCAFESPMRDVKVSIHVAQGLCGLLHTLCGLF